MTQTSKVTEVVISTHDDQNIFSTQETTNFNAATTPCTNNNNDVSRTKATPLIINSASSTVETPKSRKWKKERESFFAANQQKLNELFNKMKPRHQIKINNVSFLFTCFYF